MAKHCADPELDGMCGIPGGPFLVVDALQFGRFKDPVRRLRVAEQRGDGLDATVAVWFHVHDRLLLFVPRSVHQHCRSPTGVTFGPPWRRQHRRRVPTVGRDRAEPEGNAGHLLAPRDAVIAAALLSATDATDEAWVVFDAVRDESGSLIDLRVLHGNPAYWELSGMDPATAVGRPVMEVMPRIDWTRGLAKLFFDAMASGRSHADPHAHTAPQSGPLAGQERRFELHLTVADDVLAARLRDVTERAVGEDDLATSLAGFEAIFEQAPIAMVTVGADRKLRLNQAALKLYARTSEDMTRLSFLPEAPWIPPDQAELWAEMRRVVASGEAVRGTRFALIGGDGERREVEGSSIPIITADGASHGVVTVLI